MNDKVAVTLDVSSVPYGRGVSRYTSNLARALAARDDVELSLFGVSWNRAGELRRWMAEFGSAVHTKNLQVPPKLLSMGWSFGIPPLSALVPSNQVFHAWEWQVPPPSDQPRVVTIHDLAHMMYPEVAHPEVVKRFDRLLHQWEKSVWPVIAVSQSTKDDIVRLTSLDPSRITVVTEALPDEAKYKPSKEEQEKVLQQLGLKKPFFLIVGTSEPRKNMNRMIEAWRTVQKDFDCVVVGSAGWDALPQHKGLHILQYLDSATLASLYEQASALLFASLYEGFGLPILEAFYHGCPVVTSRLSSLPEVGGEAALYCDPYSVESIVEAIKQVPAKSGKRYTQLLESMAQQQALFSWEKAAEQTVRVYQKAKEMV